MKRPVVFGEGQRLEAYGMLEHHVCLFLLRRFMVPYSLHF